MAGRVLRSFEDADVVVEELRDGRRRVSVEVKSPHLLVHLCSVETDYPDELIDLVVDVKGAAYVCDEIARDQDDRYVRASLETGLLSFVPADWFNGRRVLDFGCGSAASTVVMARMLPGADFWGVDLEKDHLGVARARAVHYGLRAEQFVLAPDGATMPAGLGEFDAVMLSAVWEHLLPGERPEVLRHCWSLLKPGGYLFVNMTPHRFSPVETHTTGLPLINYLPRRLALTFARRASKRIRRDATWEELLRKGIRGGTEREIRRLIEAAGGKPVEMEPLDGSDRIDLWLANSARGRLPIVKRAMWALFKTVKAVTREQITPELTLAYRKDR